MSTPNARRLTYVWIALLLATGATLLAGELWPARDHAVAFVAMLGALTLFKGRLIVLDYMGIRGTSRLWHGLVLGWPVVVLSLVGVAWWIVR